MCFSANAPSYHHISALSGSIAFPQWFGMLTTSWYMARSATPGKESGEAGYIGLGGPEQGGFVMVMHVLTGRAKVQPRLGSAWWRRIF